MSSSNADFESMWGKYQKKFTYAEGISFVDVLEILKEMVVDWQK